MALAFLEEELDDIRVQLRAFGHRHAIKRRGAARRLAGAQRRALANRNELRDRRVAVQHRDGLATAHGAKVFAESCLEFGDASGKQAWVYAGT